MSYYKVRYQHILYLTRDYQPIVFPSPLRESPTPSLPFSVRWTTFSFSLSWDWLWARAPPQVWVTWWRPWRRVPSSPSWWIWLMLPDSPRPCPREVRDFFKKYLSQSTLVFWFHLEHFVKKKLRKILKINGL